MSKVRIHELAKMLGKSNKEIMNVLKDKNVEVKSHMSSVEDNHIEMIRAHYGGKKAAPKKTETVKNPAPVQKTEPVQKPAAEKQPEAKTEEPKKRNITAVFRPQNSKNSNWKGNQGQRNQQRPGQGGKPPVGGSNQNRPAQGTQARSDVQSQQVRPEGRPVQNRPAQGQSGPVQNQNRPAQNQGFNQNRQGQGQNQNRQGQSQGGQNRYDNRQGQGQNQNRQGQSQGGQNRYDNRQGQGQNQNRQGQSQGGQNRYDNRQGQGQNQNRQGQSQGGQNRYDNRQGQGQNQNRQGQSGGNRYDNRPGQNRQGQGGQQNRYDNRPGQNQNRQGGSGMSIPAASVNGKPSQGGKDGGRHGNGHGRNQGGGNRPNQGGGNRPNQRRNNFRGRGLQKPQHQPQQKKEDVIKNITLPPKMTIKELADKMKVQPSVLIKKLFLQGLMVTVNHEIEYEQAEEIALEYNCIAEPEIIVDVIEELLKEEEEDTSKLKARPPVVCVMGHVDHGKTSLLDAIRETNVIDREAGGITQHIGAYVVKINGQNITFLDTPGHEAFTAMRMRGANSTDVAILVVAADDGVMPQTVEAINHAKAAGIEIIVAINKIDKPGANVERVKQELAEHELVPEDWGGSTIFVPVSAKSKEGIEQLLEMILLTAEILELKANPKRLARGLVIEAELDKGKGSVATVLVQKGTLKVGDNIAAGSSYGKVRAMMDDKGRRVKAAGPSVPVEILGLNEVPNAGEVFVETETDKDARNFAETFISQSREKLLEDTKAKMSLDDLFSQIKAGNVKELGVIVKADVQGSVEAVKQSLIKLSNEEVIVKIIHGGVGTINESDVTLAATSNAIIIGFNVKSDATAKEVADREGVDLRLYKVIYDAIADVEAAMKGMLDPIFEEKVLGHAEVRQIFKASGIGTIAGGYVLDGLFQRGCSVRMKRGEETVYDGPLASLKRFKDDVKEVKAGFECGLVLEKFNDIKEGDIVEAYTMVEVPR